MLEQMKVLKKKVQNIFFKQICKNIAIVSNKFSFLKLLYNIRIINTIKSSQVKIDVCALFLTQLYTSSVSN